MKRVATLWSPFEEERGTYFVDDKGRIYRAPTNEFLPESYNPLTLREVPYTALPDMVQALVTPVHEEERLPLLKHVLHFAGAY